MIIIFTTSLTWIYHGFYTEAYCDHTTYMYYDTETISRRRYYVAVISAMFQISCDQDIKRAKNDVQKRTHVTVNFIEFDKQNW